MKHYVYYRLGSGHEGEHYFTADNDEQAVSVARSSCLDPEDLLTVYEDDDDELRLVFKKS